MGSLAEILERFCIFLNLQSRFYYRGCELKLQELTLGLWKKLDEINK